MTRFKAGQQRSSPTGLVASRNVSAAYRQPHATTCDALRPHTVVTKLVWRPVVLPGSCARMSDGGTAIDGEQGLVTVFFSLERSHVPDLSAQVNRLMMRFKLIVINAKVAAKQGSRCCYRNYLLLNFSACASGNFCFISYPFCYTISCDNCE
jgi:hypothetical protein